jgi:ABC-type nickel/cobalt efflux system permease component RcnA
MAALPAWSWLFVGLAIAGTAWYVEMPLFFWIGAVFVAFSIVKFLWELRAPAKKQPARQAAPAHQHTAHRAAHQAAHPVYHAHHYYRCTCGHPVRATDVFCSQCGRRLR